MKNLTILILFTVLPILVYSQNSDIELEGIPSSKISFKESGSVGEKAFLQYDGKDVSIKVSETDGYVVLDGKIGMIFRKDGVIQQWIRPDSVIQFFEYVQLGSAPSAPAIRMKKLSGTVQNVVNSTINIAHGLGDEWIKVLNVDAVMEGFGGALYPPNDYEITSIGPVNIVLTTRNLMSYFTGGLVNLLVTYEK